MKISFVGLGAMGLPMAKNLARADGIELTYYDAAPARLALADGSGHLAESFADAVADADAVFSVLPADTHVRSVAADLREHGHAGQVYVDFSTIAPETMRDVADELAEVGIETIGVALTRSTAAAQAGTLALFLGGSEEQRTRLDPAFSAMATDLLPTASNGAAKAMKIVNNMAVATLDILACESLVLGWRLGFPAGSVLEALPASGADNWALTNHIAKYVIPNDLGPGRFSTRYMAKDVALCGALARSATQPGFFTGLAESCYRGVVAQGHADDYHMIVIRWLETAAGISDPVTSADPADSGDAQDLTTLANASAAVQTLIGLETLTLAAHHGLPPKQAGEYLEGGSGGSASIRAVLADDAGSLTWHFAGLAEELDAACALAAKCDVPAAIFETARQFARSLLAQHGPRADVGSVVGALS